MRSLPEGARYRRGCRWAAAVIGGLLTPLPTSAQMVLLDRPGGSLELTGYVQSLSGVLRLPEVLDSGWSGLNGGVARLAWTARLGERVVVEVHDRLLMQAGSGSDVGVAGIGVSAVPERRIDLRTTLLEGEDLLLWHDLDRLSMTVYTPWADVTLGRQAITWGGGLLFPVSDLWGRFSPFELDTQQKPGVDAVRALAYPGEGMELDLVVADAGRGEGLSAAGHLTVSRGWGDVWGGGGKFWDEMIVLAGVSRVLETTNVRIEGAIPWTVDDEEWQDPRVTLGVDRIGVRWSWSGEVHLNGLGARDPEGYLTVLAGEALARGESYLLGRWYAGGAVSWAPDAEGRLRLAVSVQGNLDDGSAAILPVASYDVGQSGRITLGGLLTTGDEPGLIDMAGAPLPVLRLHSEFGSYGQFGYLQMALYF